MLCVCYIYILGTNCNFTAKYFSAAKPVTKVLSEVVAESISVSCRCTNFLQYQYICFLQITQSGEAPVSVFPAATTNTFKDAESVKTRHCFIQSRHTYF